MSLIIITLLSITMQNSPSVISTQPPLPLPPPPPRFAGEVIVLPGPPPPIKPFAEAPNSVFQITVLPSPPSTFPPFDGGRSSSVDLSPLEFLLALVAIVTIPALIYTFIFAFGCSSSRRRERSVGENSGELSVASELSRRDVESVPTGDVADVKYKKEAHSMEIGGECPVCLSVFADGEEVRQLSVCKHSFHTTCIDLWLSNHSNCPICRATIAATTTAAVKSSGSNRDGDLQQTHRDASSLV